MEECFLCGNPVTAKVLFNEDCICEECRNCGEAYDMLDEVGYMGDAL